MNPPNEESKPKDGWDKADILLKAAGALTTPLAVVMLSFLGSRWLGDRQAEQARSLERAQAMETRARLYTELMSKREEAESALRKDMFGHIIVSFLRPEKSLLKPKEKVLNLELLAYNFHETLSLKPLFSDLLREIASSKEPRRIKRQYFERLSKVAEEITRKQMLVLEDTGASFDKTIDLKTLTFIREGENSKEGPADFAEGYLEVGGLKRHFVIQILKSDAETQRLKTSLEVRTLRDSKRKMEPKSIHAEFWLSYFDFPMIDNTRLSDDQRCAVVLNDFGQSTASITLVCFPGSYASLKERPYYEEILKKLNLPGDVTR